MKKQKYITQKNSTIMAKGSTVAKNLLIIGAFAGFAYAVSRYFYEKKQKERELREFVRFQLF